MNRQTLFGTIAAGALALMMTPQLYSLVQPPDEAAVSPEEMMAQWEKMNAPGGHQDHLKKLVGQFTVVNTLWMAPGAEPTVSNGKATNRMILDGRYLEGEYEGEMEGKPFSGRSLTGYDNMAKKYVNVWIDSMSTGVAVSEGKCDNDGTVFNYAYEMDLGEMGKFATRQVITILNADSYKLEWFEDRGEGEMKTMEIVYTRRK